MRQTGLRAKAGSLAELDEELTHLRSRLERAFGPETAAPGFTGTARSTGHCAAVSVILNQIAGAQMVSAKVQGTSHWFNRLTVDGRQVDVDLTGDQFGLEPIRVANADSLHAETRIRSFADLNNETIDRAARLARRTGLSEVSEFLEGALEERRSLDGQVTDRQGRDRRNSR